ncbi:TRAP transporter substrate-binding protein [Arsenicitalea aurantiaca]|uniref:TRAP transporter substrate-binding protein n=1 Tax=Arsenicitalea aurantiaca TaxID=1783274 RepID=A0A433XKX8_9HYPH|nr:TRAP transporter substrate-binding protein [Arsenicitalea aurantiaca]RUT34740.1 TRAP transporter substrate-binding protein [Arsenicitalea aurantiaca]
MLKALMIAGLAATVTAAPVLAQDANLIRFGFSSVADLENDNGATAWLFKQYVESRTDDLEVGIYGSSEIGSDQDVIQALQLGSGATMHIGGTALFNSFLPRVGVLDLPFMWEDYEHVGAALDGEVGDVLAAEFEQAGFKVLGWGFSWGYRNVVTRGRTVESPDDIAGLKLRTIQSPIYVAALNAMGANATPMAFGEVYTALQTGVLDGFEHAASMVYSSNLFEVTDSVALTRHLFGPTVMTYSLPLWNQLSAEQQELLQEAADFAIEVSRALAPGREQQALQLLIDEGMTITEVDTTRFAEAAIPLQDELAADAGATDLLEQIRAAAN